MSGMEETFHDLQRQDDIVPDAQLCDDAVPLPVLRQVADAVLHGVMRLGDAHLPAHRCAVHHLAVGRLGREHEMVRTLHHAPSELAVGEYLHLLLARPLVDALDAFRHSGGNSLRPDVNVRPTGTSDKRNRSKTRNHFHIPNLPLRCWTLTQARQTLLRSRQPSHRQPTVIIGENGLECNARLALQGKHPLLQVSGDADRLLKDWPYL